MEDGNLFVQQKRKATRSSLACLPCRSRHLKCDARRPQCSRCVDGVKHCYYAESRRGVSRRHAHAQRQDGIVSVGTGRASAQYSDEVRQHSYATPLCEDQNDHDFTSLGDVGGLASTTISSTGSSPQPAEFGCDKLVDSYYKNFHKFHPFILPRMQLIKLCQDERSKDAYKPLIAVLRFIGHICDYGESSYSLKEAVEAHLLQHEEIHPVMVQCRLLYSVTLFWQGDRSKYDKEINTAITLALDLGMHRDNFAVENGAGNPSLIESWRRTWWMLFILDAYYAGTLGNTNFRLMNTDITTRLPCEESEFESGTIPEARTLDEFDCREFAEANTSFSSFAYLIGAVRCAASAKALVSESSDGDAPNRVIQAADAILDGWLLLLPKERGEIMSRSGAIDELMFQAVLLIHVACIGLHRPFSELQFNAVEDVSSCAREQPRTSKASELVNIHTIRVIRSVEAQLRLIALPVRPFCHSPFVTCMINEGTLALLSACSFFFKQKELAVARDQIRMTIGCLSTIGNTWPKAAAILRETRIIARNVLGIDTRVGQTNAARDAGIITRNRERVHDPSTMSSTPVLDIPIVGDVMHGISGWYSQNELNTELSWWTNDQVFGI